ncbi:MAG TPA: sodium:solute symporter family protein [Woeseiaceae bacterium]|nr:sodium:solute symporter family protein [Woeseiaceae bacterium]
MTARETTATGIETLISNPIGVAIFGFYLVVIVVLGVVASRQQKTETDFWVAGRQFGLPILVMANMAAIMHGGAILSGVAFAGKFGGIAILPYISFVGGAAVIFYFFAKKLRMSGGFTIPDYMGDRFNSTTLRAWSAVVVALSSIIYLVGQLRGMAFVLERLLGYEFMTCLILGTIIFVAYVALGGLLAVVWTNIAQFIFMWVGLLILVPFAYEAVGGWESVLSRVEALAPGWTSPTGVSWSASYVVSWYLIWFVAYSTRIELVTKMFAARDDRVARASVPIAIGLVMLFLLYGNIYLGAAARILVWDQIGSPDQAFPFLVAQLLTPALAAVALTGIASAAMSTTDSLLLMSGSAIAHDLIRRCYDEPRGMQREEKEYLRISRYSIVVVGVVAFLCAIPDVALILRIVSYAIALVGSAFFFPLLVGMTSRRVSRQAALASSIGGTVATSIWIVASLLNVPWSVNLHPGIVGLAAAGVLMLLVTLFTPPVEQANIDKYFPETT